MDDRKKALISILVGSILGGATASVTKIGLIDFPPFSFVFVRFLIASLVLLPFVNLKTIIRNSIHILPVAIFFTINILVFIIGIKLTTATISQLLYAGVPFLTSIFLYIFFKEKIGTAKSTGVLIGFIGVTSIILLPAIEGKQFSGNLLGNALIGIGVISYSLFMVYSRNALKKYSPFVITATITFITAIIAFPLFIYENINTSYWWNDLAPASISALLYIAIVSTILTYLLNQYAIKHGGSVFASTSLYLVPLFNYLTAYILLGEKLTEGLIIGGILILVGIYLAGVKK